MTADSCKKTYQALRDNRCESVPVECVEPLLLWLCGGRSGEAATVYHYLGAPFDDSEQVRRVYVALDAALFRHGDLLLPEGEEEARRERFKLLSRAFHPDRYPELAEWLGPRAQSVNAAFYAFRHGRQDFTATQAEPEKEQRPSRPPARQPRQRAPGRVGLQEWFISLVSPLGHSRHLPQKILVLTALVCTVPLIWLYLEKERTDAYSYGWTAPENEAAEVSAKNSGHEPGVASETQPPERLTLLERFEREGLREMEAVVVPGAPVVPEAGGQDLAEGINGASRRPDPGPNEPSGDEEKPVALAVVSGSDSGGDSRPYPQGTRVARSYNQGSTEAVDGEGDYAVARSETVSAEIDSRRHPQGTRGARSYNQDLAEEAGEEVQEAGGQGLAEGVNGGSRRPDPGPNEPSGDEERPVAVAVVSGSDSREESRRQPQGTRGVRSYNQGSAEGVPIEGNEAVMMSESPDSDGAKAEPPDPVAKAMAVMDRFLASFEAGELPGLLSLVSEEPRENENTGRPWFRRSYGDLFEQTSRRSLELDFSGGQRDGEAVLLVGRYEMELRYNNGRSASGSGPVQYRLVPEDGGWKISAIDYRRAQ